MTMLRTPVTSSVIASVGYDSASSTLEVEFRTRRVYQYFRVPPAVHDALMRAQSIGEYFNRRIRNRYRSVEVRARKGKG